jgi:hypothetical protein
MTGDFKPPFTETVDQRNARRRRELKAMAKFGRDLSRMAQAAGVTMREFGETLARLSTSPRRRP